MISPGFEFFSLDRPPGDDWINLPLSAAERAREKSFRFEEDARRFAQGRKYLRVALARLVGAEPRDITLKEMPEQAPQALLRGEELPFAWNFSRSGGVGALGFAADGPVGIDIEQPKEMPDALDVAALQFSPAECVALQQVTGEARSRLFLQLWTAKEALVKATNDGLTDRTTAFTVTVAKDGHPTLVDGSEPYSPQNWVLTPIGGEAGLIGTIALAAGSQRPGLQVVNL